MECAPFFCLFIPLAWFVFFYTLRSRSSTGHLRMHCTACNHRFHATPPPPSVCPQCGRATVERM